MICYAGIGSRATPRDVWLKMKTIGQMLAMSGLILRSGRAPGADTAFHEGAKLLNGQCELYDSESAKNRPDWFNHARKYHPRFDALDRHAQHLIARNSAIVLGVDLHTPVRFIVCWTPGGEVKGGTGQALRIAPDYSIPVFNLAVPGAEAAMWQFVAGLPR